MKEYYKTILDIATAAHKGQKRWNGDPYISHPIRVANEFEDDELKCVAIGHDLFEDTKITAVGLRQVGIPSNIIEAIQILTHDKNIQTYLEYILEISKNTLATKVKLADLKDNMKDLRKGSMLEKYQMAEYLLK